MPQAAKKTQAAATKTKAKAAPKADGEKKSSRSNFSKLYPEDAKLELVVTENPKRKGSKSAARFEGYTGAKTVGDALANGVTYQDIVYDLGRAYIKVA